MVKGYWIAHVDVTDPKRYEAYRTANAEPFHKYGATFLIRAGAFECVEGASRSRHVVMEFKDYDTALACYRSSEYQKAITLRRSAAEVDLVVIAGYDGLQPPPASETIPVTASKGYWVGHIDVTEPEGYKAYMTADVAPIGQYGGRFLVRGGAFERIEGSVRSRCVLLEFPSYATALAGYRSPAYQAAATLRKGKADFDLIVCEGYEGPQP
jgi:uncharacterized protein (DUF1330 family)